MGIRGVTYVEVNDILFGVVRVSGSNLETHCQLVVLLQVFEEAVLSVWGQ